MRILLLANNVAGVISFRFEVVKAIIEQGHFITISAPFDKRMNELEAIGAKCVTTEIDRRSTNPVKDFMLICHYVNLIRKEKPDVVLSYTIKPNVYGGMVCRLYGIPQIVNILDLELLLKKHQEFRRLYFCFIRLV